LQSVLKVASLQFDEAALAPTYRLVKGLPGRSYGLSIARAVSYQLDLFDDWNGDAAHRRPTHHPTIPGPLAEEPAEQP
jgi:hypothetical protein